MNDMIEPSSALATINTINTAMVFVPGGAESLIQKLEREVRELAKDIDISKPKGREEIKSLAYKVARSKTALDSAGKDLKAEWLTKSNAVDAERRTIRERLDALSDEIRAPVTALEDAEKARIKRNEDMISTLELCTVGLEALTSEDLAGRYQYLGDFNPNDWSPDFHTKAERLHAGAKAQLRIARQDAKAREEAAEAEAQRQVEEAARIQAERDARIAAEAAETARIEAEAKAERDRLAAEQRAQQERDAAARREIEAKAAVERAEAARIVAEQKAERDRVDAERREKEAAEAAEQRRIAAAQQAERDRHAAAERAEREKQEAVSAERRRQEAEVESLRQAEAKRAADKAHRTKINNAALEAIVLAISEVRSGDREEIAKAVITAIARNEVPHIRIGY